LCDRGIENTSGCPIQSMIDSSPEIFEPTHRIHGSDLLTRTLCSLQKSECSAFLAAPSVPSDHAAVASCEAVTPSAILLLARSFDTSASLSACPGRGVGFTGRCVVASSLDSLTSVGSPDPRGISAAPPGRGDPARSVRPTEGWTCRKTVLPEWLHVTAGSR
jgi:hypothetical protein